MNKILPILLVACLSSCKKEGRTIRYEVDTTGRAFIDYINADEQWQDRDVIGAEQLDTVLVVDTASGDTSYTLQLVGWAPTSWALEFEAEHDFGPGMTMMVDGDTATARIYVNGALCASRTVDRYAAPVMVNP